MISDYRKFDHHQKNRNGKRKNEIRNKLAKKNLDIEIHFIEK